MLQTEEKGWLSNLRVGWWATTPYSENLICYKILYRALDFSGFFGKT
jgi:hypothetical protein